MQNISLFDHPYDALCKKVLSYSFIIAYILKETSTEFSHIDIQTIISLFIAPQFDVPSISLICGDKESLEDEHGSVRFDILVPIGDPSGGRGILLNIEQGS